MSFRFAHKITESAVYRFNEWTGYNLRGQLLRSRTSAGYSEVAVNDQRSVQPVWAKKVSKYASVPVHKYKYVIENRCVD